MEMGKRLSDGEWKLMSLLWEQEPRTTMELVAALREDTGWTKGTVFMMLSRMAEKGAVRYEEQGRRKFFYPVWGKEQVQLTETENFLSKVYEGSVGLMVASMAGQKSLSKEDIRQLYDILKEAEREAAEE